MQNRRGQEEAPAAARWAYQSVGYGHRVAVAGQDGRERWWPVIGWYVPVDWDGESDLPTPVPVTALGLVRAGRVSHPGLHKGAGPGPTS
jgi:hypothetical protein